MPRKRKRISVRPKPIFGLLLGVNVVVGLLWSPLTALREVRIRGAAAWDQARLQMIAESVKGIPCAQVNSHDVESQVLQDSEVKTARFSRNLFGSAVLSVDYREPVAVLDQQPDVALSTDGVTFFSRHLPPNLPVVKIDGENPMGSALIAGSWPVQTVAKLAVQMGAIFKGRSLQIELGKGQVLCLNMGAEQVVFGSCDDIDSKVAALQSQLAKDPQLLDKYQSLPPYASRPVLKIESFRCSHHSTT
jgi:cell division septal protein FtsQ